jgi:hypothetical protein
MQQLQAMGLLVVTGDGKATTEVEENTHEEGGRGEHEGEGGSRGVVAVSVSLSFFPRLTSYILRYVDFMCFRAC